MASFPSIRIEGGLFGPDFLDQVARGEVAGQKSTDFSLETRRNLTDEIAAAFADARAYWDAFNNRLERIAEDDLATSLTREGWMLPFLNTVLKYNARFNQKAYDVGGLSFAISHRASDHEDAPPVHIVGYRQDLGRVPDSGRPRLSPHALLQEFLNRHEHLWGIVTNGKTLRILRDSTFIRRQAYLEFDLSAIFEEQRFEDFSILYRLLHRTRLPYGQADGDQCLLEQYYSASQAEGVRVREHLRDGVEECLLKLANGFLNHHLNDQLRQDISQGKYAAEKMYQHLLRIVYRLLFLIVSEDRRLLTSNSVYTDYYSIARLRRLVQLPAAHTHDADLCHSLQVLWRILSDDTPQKDGKPLANVLDLPVLNGELFTPIKLDDCLIDNRQLLDAIEQLTYWKPKPNDPPRRVNYAALDVEELGSVYESLLELHPEIHFDTRGLPQFLLPKGAGRKESGSYYTPPSLVNELIHSALGPVIEERLKAAKAFDKGGDTTAQQKTILDIKVIDPACGSGHLILAAARRLGKELARLRTGEEEPPPERNREAIRDVISHCIYGVDKNPLAVDLCRVALWLESHCTGKPLTFLDHRVRHGDSLVGVFDLSVLSDGIPQDAYKALEGDDKETIKALAARNKEELRGQSDLFAVDTSAVLNELKFPSIQIDTLPDDSPELIREKKRCFELARRRPDWVRNKEACDLWTGAFFAEKTVSKAQQNSIPTSMVISDHLSHRSTDQRYIATARTLADRNDFFHWPLEFPEIFSRGGFDVVLSNPPWEGIRADPLEFFAARFEAARDADNAAARKKIIAELAISNPSLLESWQLKQRQTAAIQLFCSSSKRFPNASGKSNTMPLFTELAANLVNNRARAGVVVKSVLGTDLEYQPLFSWLVSTGRLHSFYDFVNQKEIFQAVHRQERFALLTLTAISDSDEGLYAFLLTDTEQLKQPGRITKFKASDLKEICGGSIRLPNISDPAELEVLRTVTSACHGVTFLSKASGIDSSIMYDAAKIGIVDGVCTAESFSPDVPHNRFTGFNRSQTPVVGVYEGKLFGLMDHRRRSFFGISPGERYGKTPSLMALNVTEKQDFNMSVEPRYWVPIDDVLQKLAKKRWNHEWCVVYGRKGNRQNYRTFSIAVVPLCGAVDVAPFLVPQPDADYLNILIGVAVGQSLMFDFLVRTRLIGFSIGKNLLEEISVPLITRRSQTPWFTKQSLTTWLLQRVMELSFTSWDLQHFARDLGYEGEPFLWDEDRRAKISAELNAGVFILYSLRRSQVEFVLDSFTLMRKREEASYGFFITKQTVLEVFDAMEESRRSGTPWVSPLTFPDLELQSDGDKAQVSVRDDANSQDDIQDEADGDEDDDHRSFDDETTDTDDLGDDEIEPDDEKTEARIRQYNTIDDYLTEDLMYAVRKTYTERGSRLGYDREEGLQALRKYLNMGSLGSNIRYALENAVITALKREVIYSLNGSHYLWRRTLKDYIQETPDPYKNLRKYLRAAMGSNAWQEEAEAITAATRYLGFARTTEQMTKIFKSVINSAIRRGIIERDGSRIRKV